MLFVNAPMNHLLHLPPNPQPQARNFGDQHQCTAEGIAFTTTPRG